MGSISIIAPNFAVTKTFNDSHVIKKEHYLYKIVKPYS
jgi:hypothetical protein